MADTDVTTQDPFALGGRHSTEMSPEDQATLREVVGSMWMAGRNGDLLATWVVSMRRPLLDRLFGLMERVEFRVPGKVELTDEERDDEADILNDAVRHRDRMRGREEGRAEAPDDDQ